jgi:hypothetical protein
MEKELHRHKYIHSINSEPTTTCALISPTIEDTPINSFKDVLDHSELLTELTTNSLTIQKSRPTKIVIVHHHDIYDVKLLDSDDDMSHIDMSEFDVSKVNTPRFTANTPTTDTPKTHEL